MTNKDDYEKFKEQGNERYKTKDYEGAKELYSKAIEVRRDAVVYANRAACELTLKQYYQALDDCNKAIELDDKYCKAYFRRGKALRGLFRFSLALKDFNRVLTFEPDNDLANEQVKQISELLRENVRLTMNTYDKPDEFRSKKPLQKFSLNNQYSGSKKYSLR